MEYLFFGIIALSAPNVLGVIGWASLFLFLPWLFMAACKQASRSYDRNYALLALFVVLMFSILYLTGIFNVVSFTITHWVGCLIGTTVYFLFAFPYTRYFIWKDRVRNMYRNRAIKIQSIKDSIKYRQEQHEKGAIRTLSIEDSQKEIEELNKPIRIIDYKSEFINCMLWWPLMGIYNILDKYIFGILKTIRKLFNKIVNRFMSSLQKDSEAEYQRSLKEDYLESDDS